MKHPHLTVISSTNKKGADMNALALEAKALAERLSELDREGGTVRERYARVGRKAGVSPGTVENTIRGRLKAKAAWVRGCFQNALIRELEKEQRALEHELSILRLSASRPDSDEIFAAMASLKTVRETLDRARG